MTNPSRSAARCDRIIALIDECLTEYDSGLRLIVGEGRGRDPAPCALSAPLRRQELTMSALTFAVLAVLATEIGDHTAAGEHLDAAQRHSRTAARRERQVVEIAALIVAGDHERARGLSFEHRSEFPADDEVLRSLLSTSSPAGQRGAGRAK